MEVGRPGDLAEWAWQADILLTTAEIGGRPEIDLKRPVVFLIGISRADRRHLCKALIVLNKTGRQVPLSLQLLHHASALPLYGFLVIETYKCKIESSRFSDLLVGARCCVICSRGIITAAIICGSGEPERLADFFLETLKAHLCDSELVGTNQLILIVFFAC